MAYDLFKFVTDKYKRKFANLSSSESEDDNSNSDLVKFITDKYKRKFANVSSSESGDDNSNSDSKDISGEDQSDDGQSGEGVTTRRQAAQATQQQKSPIPSTSNSNQEKEKKKSRKKIVNLIKNK